MKKSKKFIHTNTSINPMMLQQMHNKAIYLNNGKVMNSYYQYEHISKKVKDSEFIIIDQNNSGFIMV